MAADERPIELSDEAQRKDEYFRRLSVLADEMIAAYGRDFALGALILAARFIAGARSVTKPEPDLTIEAAVPDGPIRQTPHTEPNL